MPRLLSPAELTLWGWGCETKSTLRMRLEPMGGGAWVEITTPGHYMQPAAQRGDRHAVLLLDDAETSALLDAVLAPEPPSSQPVDDPTMPDSVGCLQAKLPVETGCLEVHLNEASRHRLIAVADHLLALTERAGLPVGEMFHPVARAYR